MSTTLQTILTAIAFIIVLPTGWILAGRGRPHSTLLGTVHKLLALAAAVLIVLTVRRLNQEAPLSAVELTATVVTGALFASLAATGALLSGERPTITLVSRVHQIVPYLCLLSSAGTLYLVLSR